LGDRLIALVGGYLVGPSFGLICRRFLDDGMSSIKVTCYFFSSAAPRTDGIFFQSRSRRIVSEQNPDHRHCKDQQQAFIRLPMRLRTAFLTFSVLAMFS
jgi:hypothetical protein